MVCRKSTYYLRDKAKWMAIGFNEVTPDIIPKVGETPLERVTDFNYLGGLLNEKLDFSKHEDKVYNKQVNYIN